MMNFFRALDDHKLLVAHVPFLDWIFTEKFDKTRWNNKNRIQSFTKLLYKYPGLTEKNRVYDWNSLKIKEISNNANEWIEKVKTN